VADRVIKESPELELGSELSEYNKHNSFFAQTQKKFTTESFKAKMQLTFADIAPSKRKNKQFKER